MTEGFSLDDFASAVETSNEVKTAEELGTQVQPEAKVEPTEPKAEENVEPKEEPTEPKAEEKGEEKKESFFDKFTKPEAEKVEEKVEQPQENTELLEQFEAIKQELEKYKSSPLAKLLGGDYDLTKVDLKDFLKQAVGEDYSNLGDEALIQKSLQSNPNWDRLTEDEQAEELELQKTKLEGMSRLEKLEYRESLINKLNGSKDVNEIFKTLEEIQTNQKNTIANPDEWYKEKVASEFEERFNHVKSSIQNIASSIIGQEFNNYKVTQEDAEAMVSLFEKEVKSFNEEDKAFTLFKAATYERAIAEAEKRGRELERKAISNPSQVITDTKMDFKGEKTGLEGLGFDDFRNIR